MKTRNSFLKSALNVISKKTKKQIKSLLQLSNDPKSWRTLKKEMGYPNKESSYSDLKNGSSISKTDGDKLKLFVEQLKSMFATKIDLKDKNLEKQI